MAIASILGSIQNPFLCLREPTSPRSRSVVFSRYLEPCGRRWIPRSIRACQPSDKLGGDGGTSASAKRLHFGKQLLSFASDNFLPLALVSGVGLGFANPTLGCLADKYSFTKISTCGIFIISDLYFVAHSILLTAYFAGPTPTSGTCYRAGYILLYANHLIKWCCPYSPCWWQCCSCSCGDCGIQLIRNSKYSILGIKIHSWGSRCFFSD